MSASATATTPPVAESSASSVQPTTAPTSSEAPVTSSSAVVESSAPASSASTTQPASSAPPASSAASSAPASSAVDPSRASSAAPTSNGASASSGAVASSATSASASRSQVVSTSYVITTITNADGSVSTSANPVTVTSTVASGSSGGGSNTGAIVGGVVGGVVGLALIGALLFFLLRKRRRSHRDDFDDNMFDPNRAQNHAAVDLADDGHTVEPFYTPGVASTAQSPQMSQYLQSAAATSDGGYGAQGVSRGPSSATSAGYAGHGAFGSMQMPQPQPSPALPPVTTGAAFGAAATAGMSAKQREAYQERQNRAGASNTGYGNQSYQPYGQGSGQGSSEPMSPAETSTSGPVTVAEDGGAYDDTIPPTYDSIPRDR